MTYEIRSGDRRVHYDTLPKAVLAHTRNVTGRLPSTLYGPETLASDGIMHRDVIADYSPPEPPTDRERRSPPPGGSVRAYWYALGQVDAMGGLAWYDESDAARFSGEQAASPQSTFKVAWAQYMERNKPREE